MHFFFLSWELTLGQSRTVDARIKTRVLILSLGAVPEWRWLYLPQRFNDRRHKMKSRRRDIKKDNGKHMGTLVVPSRKDTSCKCNAFQVHCSRGPVEPEYRTDHWRSTLKTVVDPCAWRLTLLSWCAWTWDELNCSGDHAVVGGVQDTRKGSKIKTKTTMEKEDTLPGGGSPPPDPGCRRSPRELWGRRRGCFPSRSTLDG